MSDIQTKEYPERENKMGTMPVPKLLIDVYKRQVQKEAIS